MTAEAGVHRHDEDEIDQIDDMLDAADRRAGVHRDAGFLAERTDRLQRTVKMRAGFDMHGDDVGACLGEGFEIGIARRDHEMDVERLLGDGPQRLHDVGADGDVRHEMPVHHVDMDPVGAGRLDGADLFAEAREVRRQDGGRDQERAVLHNLSMPAAKPPRNRAAKIVVNYWPPKRSRQAGRAPG